jgi:GTP cyclohydrolase II
MNVHIGPRIRLATQHGPFGVLHVTVQDAGSLDGAPLIREGVVLQSLTTSGVPLVRVQSSCLFSESFWATDCDCALQLQASLERIAADGGFVLYFYEEGRGAGLAAKFKAIELQQVQNMDTKAAYECLKMSVDGRSYDAAAEVIKKLVGTSPIRLLTNNPSKQQGLTKSGVNVVERQPLIVGTESPAVRRYLKEKAQILGHEIPPLE